MKSHLSSITSSASWLASSYVLDPSITILPVIGDTERKMCRGISCTINQGQFSGPKPSSNKKLDNRRLFTRLCVVRIGARRLRALYKMNKTNVTLYNSKWEFILNETNGFFLEKSNWVWWKNSPFFLEPRAHKHFHCSCTFKCKLRRRFFVTQQQCYASSNLKSWIKVKGKNKILQLRTSKFHWILQKNCCWS